MKENIKQLLTSKAFRIASVAVIILTLLISVGYLILDNARSKVREEALEEIKLFKLDGVNKPLGDVIEQFGADNDIDINMYLTNSKRNICEFTVSFTNTDALDGVNHSRLGKDEHYDFSDISSIPTFDSNNILNYEVNLKYDVKTNSFKKDYGETELKFFSPEKYRIVVITGNTYESAEYLLKLLGNETGTVKVSQENTSSRDSKYYSVIKPTGNGGMHFEMTLEEFVDKYNQHAGPKYKLNYYDFKSNNELKDVRNVTYQCVTPPPLDVVSMLLVHVESETGYISRVQLGIDRDSYLSFSKDENMELAYMRMYITQALIDEIENVNDFQEILDVMAENNEKYREPSVYIRGLFHAYDTSKNISAFEWEPVTEKRYEEYFNKVTSNN